MGRTVTASALRRVGVVAEGQGGVRNGTPDTARRPGATRRVASDTEAAGVPTPWAGTTAPVPTPRRATTGRGGGLGARKMAPEAIINAIRRRRGKG